MSFLGIMSALLLGTSAVSYSNCEEPFDTCQEPVGFCDEPFKCGTADISVYGFVKFETLTVNRITGNYPEIFPQMVPLSTDRADDHYQTIIDARSSRIGVKAIDQFWDIKIKGVIEGDFFDAQGDALVFNTRLFRVRLAYARADMPSGFFFLAGQYWILPMGIPDIPAPLYVNTQLAPVGVAYARQPQLRVGYKRQVRDWGEFQIEADMEKHAFNDLGFITPETGEPAQGGEQPWPLFAGKISWLGENFKCSFAGAGSQTRYIFNDLGSIRRRNIWAVCGIASYKWNRLTLWGTVNHNVGLNTMFTGYFNNMAFDSLTNRLFAIKSTGGCGAIRFDWIPDVLISDVMCGTQQGKHITGTPFSGVALKRLTDVRANIFYKFWCNWQAAIEYQAIYVKAFNKTKGHANAVHAAIWYNFGTP